MKVVAKELKEQGLYKAKGVITRLPRAAVAEVSTYDPEAVVQVRAELCGTLAVAPCGHAWLVCSCVGHRAQQCILIVNVLRSVSFILRRQLGKHRAVGVDFNQLPQMGSPASKPPQERVKSLTTMSAVVPPACHRFVLIIEDPSFVPVAQR